MGSSFQCFSVLSWNVCGLGNLDKCSVVKDTLVAAKTSVFCLQETKLRDVAPATVHALLPSSHAATFHTVNADGSRGGMLTAWDANIFALTYFITHQFTVTTVLSSTSSDLVHTVTNVYGPADHRDSALFLESLGELALHISGPWLITRDFNLVRSAADKNVDG